MKIWKLAAATVLASSIVSPASAQSLPDDLRCLLLSNIFAKSTATPEASRQVAAQSMLYYAGRIDGRADAKAIAAAVKSMTSPDPKTAGAQMSTCAARFGSATQSLRNTISAAAPHAPTPAPTSR